MRAVLPALIIFAGTTFCVSQAAAQDATAEVTALRVVVKAQRTAAPDYADVPRIEEDYADVELLEDDDQADIPLLRGQAVVARLN